EVRDKAGSDFRENDASGFERFEEAARQADCNAVLVPVDLAKARVELEAPRLQPFRGGTEIGPEQLLGAVIVSVVGRIDVPGTPAFGEPDVPDPARLLCGG